MRCQFQKLYFGLQTRLPFISLSLGLEPYGTLAWETRHRGQMLSKKATQLLTIYALTFLFSIAHKRYCPPPPTKKKERKKEINQSGEVPLPYVYGPTDAVILTNCPRLCRF